MTMTMAGGVGGGPGTWNIYIYINVAYRVSQRIISSIFIYILQNYITRWWFQILFMFTLKIGEDSHVDEHIFQMGWFNHQPDNQKV